MSNSATARSTLLLVVTATAMVAAWLIIRPVLADRNESNATDVTLTSTSTTTGNTTANPKYQVTVRKPTTGPRISTGLQDVNGNVATVACGTCHSNRAPNIKTKTVADLKHFHRSLQLSHGSISCLSCHNSSDYDALKLADGTRVEFTEVMTLCAQCHGPQMRDYEHGTHGGMSGYWDLSRGPQAKNNCVDCHNPHAPQFPKMKPTFKPQDRFLKKATTHPASLRTNGL